MPLPAEVRVDDREVVGPSPIARRGRFAVADIVEGVVIVRLGGNIVTSMELDGLITAADFDAGASYIDIVTIDEDAHLVPAHWDGRSLRHAGDLDAGRRVGGALFGVGQHGVDVAAQPAEGRALRLVQAV
jgi:hypothetical protein